MLKLQAHSSRALLNALKTVERCQAKKNTMAILDYILLSGNGDKLMLTASSDAAQITVPAPLSIVGGELKSPAALPSVGLISYLSTLPDCVVNFTLDEDNSLAVNYCFSVGDNVKSGQASLTYLDGSDFPLFPALKDGDHPHIVLPGNVFSGAIDAAKSFAANDDLRIVMNSLYIDVAQDGTECYLVATDGKLLMKDTYKGKEPFLKSTTVGSFNICNAYFGSLSAFANANEVNIETDYNQIRISADDIVFVCKPIEGKYPNYNAVIPQTNAYYVVFDKKEMIDSIKRASVFGCADSRLVRFHKDGMYMGVSAQDADYATKSDEQVLLYDSNCIDGFEIGLAADKFVSALSAIDAEQIRMKLSDPTRPCVCSSNDAKTNMLTLCMPMHLH